ncbi:Sec-independent protein translocase protein TATB, chloroplastic [Vitis vinifera]|uniref:Sec-independent protein translocase protein TATB, chloroplastic n=1 Tax=Vitis vinifera TaxID=29760 RepID=A0A438IZ45_VITVI|nr:Sec-independent protein translocase protein TATB, chloroplastic [Vitis vinifera]
MATPMASPIFTPTLFFSSPSTTKSTIYALSSSSSIPLPKGPGFHFSTLVPQPGLGPFSSWNGLRHLGISVKQKSLKIGRRGRCKGKVVYASLFGVGAPEALVIGVVALLVFGPKGLAEVARNLGKTLREFQPTIKELQEVSKEFKSTLEKEIGFDEISSSIQDTYRPRTTNPTTSTPSSNAGIEDSGNVIDPKRILLGSILTVSEAYAICLNASLDQHPAFTNRPSQSLVMQCVLPRPVSNYFPILLDGEGLRRGPMPFCFILAAKLRALKFNMKTWNGEVFGQLEVRKARAIEQATFWDTKERSCILSLEEEPFSEEEEVFSALSGFGGDKALSVAEKWVLGYNGLGALGLKINLEKSLPLGASFKSTIAWDGVEEWFHKRIVRLRLEQIQGNFLWGSGALEHKPHLFKWVIVKIRGKRAWVWGNKSGVANSGDGAPSLNKAYSSEEYLKITEEQLKASAAQQQSQTPPPGESQLEPQTEPLGAVQEGATAIPPSKNPKSET